MMSCCETCIADFDNLHCSVIFVDVIAGEIPKMSPQKGMTCNVAFFSHTVEVRVCSCLLICHNMCFDYPRGHRISYNGFVQCSNGSVDVDDSVLVIWCLTQLLFCPLCYMVVEVVNISETFSSSL